MWIVSLLRVRSLRFSGFSSGEIISRTILKEVIKFKIVLNTKPNTTGMHSENAGILHGVTSMMIASYYAIFPHIFTVFSVCHMVFFTLILLLFYLNYCDFSSKNYVMNCDNFNCFLCCVWCLL